jgi:hypothetical protein
MSELIVDDSIAMRLRQIAEQENRPLDAVLAAMLAAYPASREPSDWPLKMAMMAEADTDIEWNEYATDLSERSREILNNEFGAHLLKRLNENDNDPT